mgnify:FL=1
MPKAKQSAEKMESGFVLNDSHKKVLDAIHKCGANGVDAISEESKIKTPALSTLVSKLRKPGLDIPRLGKGGRQQTTEQSNQAAADYWKQLNGK